MKITKIFLLFFILLLISCDPYIYNIKIEQNGFRKEFVFGCGKLEVSASIIGYSQTNIVQRFKIDIPISINPKKIKALYKNQVLSPTVYLNGNIIKNITELSGENTINVTINHMKVENGDTIKININDFIICREQPIGVNDINLIFMNRK